MAEVEIKGAAELKRMLGELPAKIEQNVVRGALRAAAKVIEQEAKANVPVNSGDLRASIRVSAGTKRGGRVYAHVKAGGRKKGDPFYAHFVEFGTRPHEIRPRGAISLFFAGLFSKLIKHPGAKAKPYMRPAFDRKSDDAIRAFTDYARGRIEKIAKVK